MDYIYSVRLPNGMRCEGVADSELQLKMGDFAILRREHSLEYVQVLRMYAGGPATPERAAEIARIQRVATMMDRATATENEAHAKSAYRTACQMVETMKLPMKLLNASYSFDRKLVTIQFTADGRVDFRELVKELSHALGSRLDLRQIGVRDETGICGGIAVCGQVLCCSRFLREFNSINVRMAKDQDLSLTPATISGVCGRLKCCLKYEHEGYVEMEKEMPRRGELCECDKGRGRVSDRNMLTKKVTLQLEEGGSITLDVSEVKFRLRSGKRPESAAMPAKTDPEAKSPAEKISEVRPPRENARPAADAGVPPVPVAAPVEKSSADSSGSRDLHEDAPAAGHPEDGENGNNRNKRRGRRNRRNNKNNPRRNHDGSFDRRPDRYDGKDDAE